MFEAIGNDWTLLLIPPIAAFIGWFTNWQAVKMMFYPLEFRGIRPWFGWQGIVPANAVSLAGKSTDLITTKLMTLRELFATFKGDEFKKHLGPAMDEATDQVMADLGKSAGPTWAAMPDPVKAQVRMMVRAEIDKVNVAILDDMAADIEKILDLRGIVTAAAARDKKLITEMFQTVGRKELRFITDSGAYFGLLFGIPQMITWIYWPTWWQLPFCGFLVGYITNWLALKLVFQPRHPVKVGPFTVHGLFHKRQEQVAKEFARLVAGEIINPENMVAHMTQGAAGEHLFAIIDRHIGAMIDRYRSNPMTAMLVPAERWDGLKTEVMARMREELPKPGGFLHIFTRHSVDVHGELFTRMTRLDPISFEGVLRPAFQQDEWKLIVIGGVLGLAAGIFQVLYMFRDYVA
ncbi:MAG TPA: hypothetical protein VL172_07500 [Kofleriaceae bacterium]|nr:hypothetical protein [Kofleriaceae bacterium]